MRFTAQRSKPALMVAGAGACIGSLMVGAALWSQAASTGAEPVLVESPAATVEAIADAAATVAPQTPAGTAAADPILDARGVVDAEGYRAMAGKLAGPRGIAYRFGSTGPAAPQAKSSGAKAWQPSEKHFNDANNPGRTYQVGGPQRSDLNDYSSNQGQLAYVPTSGASTLGIDHVATLEMGENTFSYKPRLTWTYSGKGHPEPEFTKGEVGAKCVQRIGARFGRTVAQARAYAHGEAMASTFVAFDNGVIATAGHNTAQAGMCLKLPGGLRPSAISVTNGNEFVLVTAWDPATLTSKLAVIAVGGSQPSGKFWDFEWPELYPGMSNYGNPTFVKLLGVIPLPMAAPTSLSAVSNAPFGRQITRPGGGSAPRGQFSLSNEANRKTFVNGPNRDLRPRAGYAVVASKSEHKVAFVDLQPLFDKVTGAYFGSRSTFDKVTHSVGTKPAQWPYSFSVAPSERPRVVKTVSTTQAPTAVAAALNGSTNPRAYVGTMDGALHIYRTGGLATRAAATSSGVKHVGSVAVGRNPTGITYPKDHAISSAGGTSLPDNLTNTLIVTSRADRLVRWVALKGDTVKIRRTLRDSRLVDPIAAEDNNNHGTQSYVISIADYGAGRLFNYRYGPIVFATNGGSRHGMGPSRDSPFEFGGAYDPHGKPFSISVTNVT